MGEGIRQEGLEGIGFAAEEVAGKEVVEVGFGEGFE